MRIVAGRHRGRRLAAPEGLELRPTADRAREALFNILEHGRFSVDGTSPLLDARVLDAFAGTGALGLEALSRGAAHLTAMDKQVPACTAIRANAHGLGESGRVRVLQVDATDPPPAPTDGKTAPCDLVFLDPPYGSGLAAPALAALAARGWMAPGAICVAEVAATEALAAPDGFTAIDERRYGKTRIVFLRRA
jgi:16S rRNA (guanine966-N2)-methyltransferase